MFVFTRLLAALIFLFPVSSVVSAETEMLPIAKEISSSQSNDILEIVEAWTINSFARVNGDMSGECTMRAKYSNGFELTFKGQGSRLTALRIEDTDKQKQGSIKGFIGLNIGNNAFGLQSRVRQGRIDASLLTVPAVGELIISEPTFSVRIGAKKYEFSSAGFKAGYNSLLECQRQYIVKTLKVVNDTHPIIVDPVLEVNVNDSRDSKNNKILELEKENETLPRALIDIESNIKKGKNNMPLAMALSMIIPSGFNYQFDGSVNAMAPVHWNTSGDWKKDLQQAVLTQNYFVDIQEKTVKISSQLPHRDVTQKNVIPIGEADHLQQNKEWFAREGESLINTLNNWARIAGVKTDIRLDQDVTLKKDFRLNAPFESAVNELLKRSTIDTETKPTAVIVHSDEENLTAITDSEDVNLKKQMDSQRGQKGWRALEGTDLKNVLARWSDVENVQLIWNTDKRFLVRSNIKVKSSYSDAIKMILKQYEGKSVRPVAQLNTDPDTGKTALIIEVN